MLMPKKNRNAIYEHLFKEGVMVAEKDFNAPKHPELESVPNLQVRVVAVIDNCPQYNILCSGHQGPDFPEVPRLREGAVCLEALLLEPDQRGYPVPA